MSTLINITPTGLFTLGGISTCIADKDDTLDTIGNTLTVVATTLTLCENGAININAHAEVNTTKAYVQSLSEEDLARMEVLLDEKELMITDEVSAPKTESVEKGPSLVKRIDPPTHL